MRGPNTDSASAANISSANRIPKWAGASEAATKPPMTAPGKRPSSPMARRLRSTRRNSRTAASSVTAMPSSMTAPGTKAGSTSNSTGAASRAKPTPVLPWTTAAAVTVSPATTSDQTP